nr:T9SS type A sorting domain-containing protein [Bacteroidota bacterium]
WPYNNNSNTSDIPTNLSEVANTIINLGSLDNYQYNTDEGTTGDKNTLLALIGDETNWNVNDAHAFITLIASFNNTDYGQLPIQLLSFNATKINQSVEINWSTASETNNDYFTIERSIDAENFEIVKTVSGAGNSNEIINYSEIDNNPINGISYYRLKQTDFNSDFTYSEIIAVENLTDNLSLKILNTYSNPNSINFTVSNPNLENLSFEVINTLGEVLISTKVDYVIQKSKIVVNTEDLSHGLYFIKLSSDKETVVKKVLF